MKFSSTELLQLLTHYLWPFFRIGATVAVAPIFGARTVPARLRLGLAVMLTIVIAPLLPPPPAIDPVSVQGMLVTTQQLLIGLAMGFAVLLIFGAFVLGGQIFAMQMGLGFAAMVDPQRGVQVPMVSQFYVLVATLIFLTMDGHLVLISVLVGSFETIPVGVQGLGPAGLWTLVSWVSDMFVGAILMALPAITTLMLVNIAFGVMMRAAPQLNIFAVGFPISLTLGFVIMLVMLPNVAPRLVALVGENFAMIGRMLAAGA